jgi:hypothetical protein
VDDTKGCAIAEDATSGVYDTRRCTLAKSLQAPTPGVRGLRLGRTERRLLLAAGPELAVIRPQGTGRSAAVAHQRAIARLVRAGLLAAQQVRELLRTRTPTRFGTVERHYFCRAIRLTELGKVVVMRFGQELANGRRIRWGAGDGLAGTATDQAKEPAGTATREGH